MSAIVGRERELAFLHQGWRRALEGHGSTILVSAEAGAGKSTLITRFLTEARASTPEALVISAMCSEQYGAGEPYQPFVETFRHLMGDRGGRRRRSLKEIAGQLAPYWVAAIPLAGEVIAASMATVTELRQAFQKGGTAAAPSEEALFFQYTELFFAASAECPILLFLDDLHWADRASVSLLTHLGRHIADRRVLIVGSYRAVELDAELHALRDARQELRRYSAADELTLEPLDRTALAELVRMRTNAEPDTELMDWLARYGGTNALYFEELLTWIQQQNLTRERHGELQLVKPPREIDIPRSVASTIEKRLDRLDEQTRRVLEYASVQGNDFDSVTLAQLLDMDELELEEVLAPIVRVHRLVTAGGTRDLPNGDIASVYRFSHSLVQDVLHGSLQGKRRILLHRKMAQIIEDLHPDDGGASAHRLSVHFEEGRQPDRAFRHSLIAAARASAIYAHWDALDQIRRALRNANDPSQVAEAYGRLGEEYLSISRFADAIVAFTHALEAIRDTDDATQLLVLRHQRLLAERNHGTRALNEILDDLQLLCNEAAGSGETAEQCRIIWHMMDLPGTTESTDTALARTALELAIQINDKWLIARGHEMLGIAQVFGGAAQQAIADLERAVDLYRHAGDRGREAASRTNLALARVFTGDYSTAAREFDDMRRVFDEIVDPARGIVTRTNLGALLRILGEYDRAEVVLAEAIRLARRLDVPVRLLSAVQNFAELHEDRGEWNEAEQRWLELLRHARETGYRGEQIIAHCGIGTARLRLGDLSGGRRAERAARALVGTGIADLDLGESGHALRLFSARLAAAAGEVSGAVEMLEHLCATASGGDRFQAATYRFEQALFLRDEAPPRALAFAEEALSTFTALGLSSRAQAVVGLITHLTDRAATPANV
jgi:tetratricopeptide (TPR) repeat protein